MLRDSGGLGGAGCLQVMDSRKELITVTKRATSRFPSEPCDVPTALPVPLTANIPKRREARNYGDGLGTQPLETHPGDGGDPSGAGAAAGAAAARGQRNPGPATPEPPGAAAAPGLARLRLSLSGAPAQRLPSPARAGLAGGLLLETEWAAGRIISTLSASITLRLCGFSPATRPYRCAGRHLSSPWRNLVLSSYSFLFHSGLRALSLRGLVAAIL